MKLFGAKGYLKNFSVTGTPSASSLSSLAASEAAAATAAAAAAASIDIDNYFRGSSNGFFTSQMQNSYPHGKNTFATLQV